MNHLLTAVFVPLFTFLDRMVSNTRIAAIDPSGCTPVASFDEAGQSIYNYINGAKGTISIVVFIALLLATLVPSGKLRSAALAGMVTILIVLAFFDEVPVLVEALGGACGGGGGVGTP